MMRGDLEKYKNVYEQAVKYETMYSPFTPNNQFEQEATTPLAKRNDILDLTKVMSDTQQQYAKLEA